MFKSYNIAYTLRLFLQDTNEPEKYESWIDQIDLNVDGPQLL